MMAPRRPLALLLLLLLLAPVGAVRADTVILKNGKKIKGVVVSRNDGSVVVINPFHSRHPDMTWEVPQKSRIPASRVAEVIIEDRPAVEYRRRASKPGLTSQDHLDLALFCAKHKLRSERIRELRLALCLDSQNAEALAKLGASGWKSWAKGNPEANPELRSLEREYMLIEDEAQLAGLWKQMQALGTKRKLAYLERARRSARQPKARRDKVPVTLRSKELAGATYCIYVPTGYDPLQPTALVIGLHGGGRGGKDPTLVTGSGESAMNFYGQLAEKWGWICVCPSALRAPWGATLNSTLLEAVLEEIKLLFNVDRNRIYLTGHSMGGFGTWYWAPRWADRLAACAPCAGGGGPNGVSGKGLPVYIFHGTDDRIVGPGSDRSAAKSLLGDKKADFVYTEIDKVGHGFPAWVRNDIFRWFAGRWKVRKRKPAVQPRSSFDRKVSKEEKKAFGDPGKLPSGEQDNELRPLVTALEKGGGGAAAAADELGKRKDEATKKAVTRVLRSTRAPVDAKVYAARVLGRIGDPVSIKALARAAARAEDYRVVEAAAWGLGKIGKPECAAPLARVGKKLGGLYEKSFFGDAINFTEYRVRLKSLVMLVDALREVGDAETAIGVLDAEVVSRVFDPKQKYRVAGENDPRFRNVPPSSRRELCKSLVECLVELGDKRGIELLQRVAQRWPRLAIEAEAGIAELEAGEEG